MLMITYNEICLKGKNRKDFEKVLFKNIKEDLKRNNVAYSLKPFHSYSILEFNNENDEKKAVDILKNVFGITFIYKLFNLERDLNQLFKFLEKLSLKEFNLDVRRIDKKYSITSQDIRFEVLKRFGKRFNKNSDEKLIIRIEKNNFQILKMIEKGFSGLPVGSTGKVISLISGGIDSPVASWMMMKRGCEVILFHINTYENEKKIVEELYAKLNEYSSGRLRLIVKSMNELFGNVFSDLKDCSVEDRYRCVLFKNLMYEVAEKITMKESALGIVNGDSLAQVASQTLENIFTSRYDIKIPIFSPLIGMNKEEIIDIAKKIGTFDISIKNQYYPDYIPKRPITKSKLDLFLKLKREFEKKIKEKNV